MPFKMRGFTPYKLTDEDDDTSGIQVDSKDKDKEFTKENLPYVDQISAVQVGGDGGKFVHTITDDEHYDPNEPNFVGNFQPGVQRDTIHVQEKYPEGDLIGETEWEEGEALKNAGIEDKEFRDKIKE